jgi:hypothetical protein
VCLFVFLPRYVFFPLQYQNVPSLKLLKKACYSIFKKLKFTRITKIAHRDSTRIQHFGRITRTLVLMAVPTYAAVREENEYHLFEPRYIFNKQCCIFRGISWLHEGLLASQEGLCSKYLSWSVGRKEGRKEGRNERRGREGRKEGTERGEGRKEGRTEGWLVG